MTDPFIDHDDDTVVEFDVTELKPGGAIPTAHYKGLFGQLNRAIFGDPDPAQTEHAAKIRRSAEREAAGRALQQQAIAWLIIAAGVEVLVLLPLLVWGLFNGAVWS